MRKILLLVNPVFEKHYGRDLPPILRTFKQSGVQVEVLETEENRSAGGKAKQATADGFDAVVVCGGDGTVFDVLQGLAGSNLPLGIVPFGTGNVLAQNLKIPKDPIGAARWILSSQARSVPLGKITRSLGDGKESWFFAMAAGMGMHAALMAAVRHSQKRAGGRAAYFAAGFKLLVEHPIEAFEIEITTPNGTVLRRQASEAIAVRVSELNFWRPGGGLALPFLRLATVEGHSRWRLAQACFDAFFHGAGARDRLQSEDAPARYEDVVRVVCKPIAGLEYKAPLAIQADGEAFDASFAVIEMAGVNVQLLSANGHLSRN